MKRLAYLTIFALIVLTAHAASAGDSRNLRDRSRAFKRPVVVDGVRYDPAEMTQFEGRTLYWVYDHAAKAEGVILAFTTPEGVQDYGREHMLPSAEKGAHGSGSCSYLHPAVNAGPNDPYDWIILCPTQQISMLRDGYNDRLSYVEAGTSSYYTVIYKCYNFSPSCDILWVAPGNTVSDLNTYNMNNVASSIRFCHNIDPFSCT